MAGLARMDYRRLGALSADLPGGLVGLMLLVELVRACQVNGAHPLAAGRPVHAAAARSSRSSRSRYAAWALSGDQHGAAATGEP